MRLGELIAGVAGSLVPAGATAAGRAATPAAALDLQIAALAYDSRRVSAGTLFFCVPGHAGDGHDHAPEAVRRGATALIVERALGLGVPELVVPSARAAMAPVAARFNDDPTAELRVVGVTGTNGKTTTAFMLRELLRAAGERCALLGTVKSIVGGGERPVIRTTPEAIDLQADFRAMLDAGDSACAMEVSSHALELARTDAIHFAAAIFTNLSRDHLDFHQTMESYFQAKRRLFALAGGPDAARQGQARRERPRVSVVNVGDPYGERLAAEIDDVRTFAVEAPADYSARDLRCSAGGSRFWLDTPAGERAVTLGMPGRFNVANALGALAAVHALGAELDLLAGALERGVHVPGRLQAVDEGQDFTVLVDYAHTPDSLEHVLLAARELVGGGDGGRPGRVLCVFGAGGDRDRGKRPMMGDVVARLADVVLVTSDNPRSEDPEQIIADILAGAHRASTTSGVYALPDRADAIEQAIVRARRGDVVVIAGKGHEQGQELAGGVKLPFDDVAVAGDVLRAVRRAPAEALR
jgi:UDP-N-acetylmuramoyl-L-alanyl-D-glutamate--2,6-diaminopimelate ligase